MDCKVEMFSCCFVLMHRVLWRAACQPVLVVNMGGPMLVLVCCSLHACNVPLQTVMAFITSFQQCTEMLAPPFFAPLLVLC